MNELHFRSICKIKQSQRKFTKGLGMIRKEPYRSVFARYFRAPHGYLICLMMLFLALEVAAFPEKSKFLGGGNFTLMRFEFWRDLFGPYGRMAENILLIVALVVDFEIRPKKGDGK